MKILLNLVFVLTSLMAFANDIRLELAVQSANDFFRGDMAPVISRFDAKSQQQITPQLLTASRQMIINQHGNFQKLGKPKTTPMGENISYIFPCEMEKAHLTLQIVVDKDNQLRSFFFTPQVVPKNIELADNDFFKEAAISLGKLDALPGILCAPKKQADYPVVILVHGSGSTDRNEQFGPLAPFKDLAHGLGKHGIGTLRYDKRTFVYPKSLPTVKEETIDDVVLAVDFLKAKGVKKIYILGHSLGGYLMPRIATVTPDASGYITLAAAARPLEDLILEQINYVIPLTEGLSDEQKQSEIDKVARQVAKVKKLTPADSNKTVRLLAPVPATYWLDLQNYDPPATATAIDKPLLILQGERDYQVTMEDFNLFRAKLSDKPNVKFKSYPNLDHVFISREGTGKTTPAITMIPGHVSEEVITDISNFIKGEN